MSLFDQFVQQYQLSKTLRFELKPVGATSKLLEKEEVFRKDKALQENYEKTKPYLDRLHRAFVKEALAKEKGTFTEKELKEYAELCQKFQAAKEHKVKKDYKKQLEKREKELRQKIIQSFEQQAQAEKYSLNSKKKSKKKDQKALSILFGKEVFKILQARYGEEEETKIRDPITGKQISLFAAWQKFSGYFTKFQETRKNFYKNDGKASAIATRIIDQNLKRFCNNRVVFEKSLKGLDFSEVESNFGKSLEQVFALDFYNHCLLQEGIDEYNQILGGVTLANGEKRKGLNELINKYNQGQQDKKDNKRPYLRKLDKQILSEQEKLIGEIESEEELLAELKNFHQTAAAKTKSLKRLLPDFFKHNATYDIAKIYITKEALNTIAYRWTDEAPLLQASLKEVLKQEKIIVKSTRELPDCIALKHLKEALKQVAEKKKKFWKERYSEIGIFKNENAKEADLLWQQFLEIFQYEFQALFEGAISKKEKVGYQVFEKEFQALLQNFKITKESKALIKNFADQVLAIYQMAKYFAVEKKRQWSEDYDLGDFYTDPHKGYFEHFYQRAYEEIVQPYNRIRNYLTKKPYEEKKWKLNFENATLAAGWDQNKEAEKWAVLLRQEKKLFLGIMKKGCNQIFAEEKIKNLAPGSGQGKYQKMVYKYLPDPVKMLPKVCFSKKNEKLLPKDEIKKIYESYKSYKNEGEFKKGETFSVSSLQKLIAFYKDCLKKYEGWQCYDFQHLKPTEKYQDIKEFFEDVAKDSYKIEFQDLPAEYIRDKNQKGELYLFQIKNKDWNKGATGCKNLHTLYFEALFALVNQEQNFPFKLDGAAEIFYRPATEQAKLGSKKDRQGKKITNHKRFSSIPKST